MQINVLVRKARSACYHAGRAVSGALARREHRRTVQAFQSWLNDLQRDPPEVLIGANFGEYGGCRNHIHAIRKFSSLRTELVPGEEVLKKVPLHYFKEVCKAEFMAFQPKGVKAVHSHVYPWFVDWCHRHRSKSLRWVHTHHNWYYPEFGRDRLEPWQLEFNETFLFALKHADVALSVSKWQQAFLRDVHGVETFYLPNGVDVPLCERANPANFAKRVGEGGFILYVGRNDPVKNPAEFVQLAAELPGRRFVMMGQGLNAEVMESEWGVPVPENLTVFGGASHQETLDAIAACSVLVVTSKREGLPTLVLEAMTLGRAIVVPDEDGCMEAAGNGEYAHIYRLGDIASLAAKTELALVDRETGRRARQRVLEEYDWRVVGPRLDAIYRGGDAG